MLIQLNPKDAAEALVSAYRRYHGSAKDVATFYDVSYTTLKRWLTTLEAKGYDVRNQIAEIRDLGYP